MDVDGCALPDDRWYDFENSVWVQASDDGSPWTLGLMASLVSFVGKVLTVSYRTVPGPQEGGRSVATIESVRYTGPVRLPVAGEVVETNTELTRRPKLLNDAPYDHGWLVRFRPTETRTDRPPLERAGAIVPRLRARIRELAIHCLPATPDLELIEVGTECAATLARLDDELAHRDGGEVVLLITDDPTSPIELRRWADRTGHTLLGEWPEGALHRFLIRKELTPRPRRRDPRTGRLVDA